MDGRLPQLQPWRGSNAELLQYRHSLPAEGQGDLPGPDATGQRQGEHQARGCQALTPAEAGLDHWRVFLVGKAMSASPEHVLTSGRKVAARGFPYATLFQPGPGTYGLHGRPR